MFLSGTGSRTPCSPLVTPSPRYASGFGPRRPSKALPKPPLLDCFSYPDPPSPPQTAVTRSSFPPPVRDDSVIDCGPPAPYTIPGSIGVLGRLDIANLRVSPLRNVNFQDLTLFAQVCNEGCDCMGVNKQVFGSDQERRVFQRLNRTWGGKYKIHHNLPFLNVFNTDNLISLDTGKQLRLSESDRDKLKKTSIDFVLCDSNDSPLVCIEFDGMRKGFNTGTEYVARKAPIRNGWRKVITELKLKVAHASLFPYVVVCAQYFEDVSNQTRLNIVDAIIGSVLAFRAKDEVLAIGFDPEECGFSKDGFNALSRSEQDEIIQDWLIGVEVQANMEHNPVYRRSAELSERIGGGAAYSFLSYPELPESIPERVVAMKNALLHGVRCVVTDKKGRQYVGEAWVPNFKTPFVSEYGFMMELAELIALDKAIRNKP